MSYLAEHKIESLRMIARADKKYSQLMTEYNQLEAEFAEITKKLPSEEQDILWGFVCTSDAVDYRLLEIICDGLMLEQ